MITAISYQNQASKKYLANTDKKVYGERSISELEEMLKQEVEHLAQLQEIVKALNNDLSISNVKEIIEKHYQFPIHITPRTKKTRTYSIPYLTIHEQDE